MENSCCSQCSAPALARDAELGEADEPAAGKGGSDILGTVDRDASEDDVAESVVGIVDDMKLNEREAAALRLAIACGDANIRGALEVFK